MTINVMEEYIKITKKQIEAYMKLVFDEDFNKKYFQMFIEKYINIRYYNFYENDINPTMRRKLLDHLKQIEEDISIQNINDREILIQMRIFFYYVLYFDNVVYYKDLKKIIEKISILRNKNLDKYSDNFELELYQEMKKFIKEKEDFLKKFYTDKFFIKITNYPEKLNVYRVNLKYNIKFPVAYSELAINKVFNRGIVNEDKLYIEYYLTSIQILRDILKQNFKRKYILEFADSILVKSKKIKSLLNIVNSVAVLEKISFKIRYEQFLENRDLIYELMKEGIKFSVIIDNSFENNFKNIKSLKMFEYVLLNENLKHYEAIMEYKDSLNNFIKI